MPSLNIDSNSFNLKLDSPVHVVDLPKQVMAVEFSPFEWSQNVILLAFPKVISVASIKFQVRIIFSSASLKKRSSCFLFCRRKMNLWIRNTNWTSSRISSSTDEFMRLLWVKKLCLQARQKSCSSLVLRRTTKYTYLKVVSKINLKRRFIFLMYYLSFISVIIVLWNTRSLNIEYFGHVSYVQSYSLIFYLKMKWKSIIYIHRYFTFSSTVMVENNNLRVLFTLWKTVNNLLFFTLKSGRKVTIFPTFKIKNFYFINTFKLYCKISCFQFSIFTGKMLFPTY